MLLARFVLVRNGFVIDFPKKTLKNLKKKWVQKRNTDLVVIGAIPIFLPINFNKI